MELRVATVAAIVRIRIAYEESLPVIDAFFAAQTIASDEVSQLGRCLSTWNLVKTQAQYLFSISEELILDFDGLSVIDHTTRALLHSKNDAVISDLTELYYDLRACSKSLPHIIANVTKSKPF